ncbi:MAG: alpha/beta fold hydrolase [Cyclobacteriaceae bacterium]
MNYTPPFLLFNAHLETIYPSLLRRVSLQPYERERISTPDDDFLDLDWLKQGSSKLVILSHGLEGNTQRSYIKGMARAIYQRGYDVLAWNFRGCSEEMNKALRFYHSGATDDLATVVDHAHALSHYRELNLVGFSLGGNLTLKYLGEDRQHPASLRNAVAISVPMDLHTSCMKISQPSNWIYSQRFLRSLRKKVLQKSRLMNGIDVQGLEKIKTLQEFDDHITGPIHGFKNALDYYQQCSSIKFVQHIALPTLIVNAANDPFLSKECYPHDLLKDHPSVTFESPSHGGHVGFAQFNKNGLYWSEQRVLDFLRLHTDG